MVQVSISNQSRALNVELRHWWLGTGRGACGGQVGVAHHQVEDEDEPGHVAVLRPNLAAATHHIETVDELGTGDVVQMLTQKPKTVDKPVACACVSHG